MEGDAGYLINSYLEIWNYPSDRDLTSIGYYERQYSPLANCRIGNIDDT